MKRKLMIGLGLMVSVNLTSVAMAAPSTFSDVPGKHWAYDAVAELAKAGIVEGYGDGSFRGDRTLTRYEMAQIVANAITKTDKADEKTKATISKLAAEFADELNKLEGRVDKIDKKVDKIDKKVGNISFDGETLFEYAKLDTQGHLGSKAIEWRQRLHMNAKFNDHIDYFARIQAGNKMGETGAGNNSMAFTRAGINVKNLVGKDSVTTIGRQAIAIGRGLAFADTDNNDGIMIKNKFGKALLTSYYLSESTETDVTGVNLDYTPNQQLVFNVGAFKAEKAAPLTNETTFNEAAFSYEIKKGLNLIGDYVSANGNGNGDAYAVQLSYNWKSGMRKKMFYGWEKMVNPLVAHDQGISIAYINVDPEALPGYGNGLFKGYGNGSITNADYKGYAIGYENMLEKNLHFYATYSDLKEKVGSKKDSKTVVGIELFY